MKCIRVFCLPICLLLVSSAFGQTIAPLVGDPEEEVSTGTCDSTFLSYTISTGVRDTTASSEFTDVPDMQVSFETVPGRLEPQCVRVDFSAYVAAGSSIKLIVVRALFDGESSNLAPRQFFIEPSPGEPSLSGRYYHFTWILPLERGLAPGGHNVQIQWRSPNAGQILTHRRSLIVHHN